MVNNNFLGITLKAVATLFIAVNYCFGILYPSEFMGFHKFTRKDAQDTFDVSLFAVPSDGVFGPKIGGKMTVFCADESWHRIVYTKEGADWIKGWGTYSQGNDGFIRPLGMTIDWYGYIYVADWGNGRIVKLEYNIDSDELQYKGSFLIGASGSVWDIDFGASGNFYVTDPLNHRIYKLSESGSILVSYGQFGNGIGQFNRPRGIAVFGSNIYVADAENKRVIWIEDRGDHFEWRGRRNLTEWFWVDICDVEVDANGLVYIVDRYNCHILEFSPDLSDLLFIFGEKGYELNQFHYPGFMDIRGNDVVIIEEWGDSSGIQYYGIKVGITDAKVMIDNFDVTEQGTNFYFKLDGQASISVRIRDSLGNGVITLIEDSLMNYGAHYVEWDGRDTSGKVALPGKYICDIYATSNSDVHDVHLVFRVKGTIKSGTLSPNEHWTEEGEPKNDCDIVSLAGIGVSLYSQYHFVCTWVLTDGISWV